VHSVPGKFKNPLINLDDSNPHKPRNAVDMPRLGRKGDSCSHSLLADTAISWTTWGTSGGLEGACRPEFAGNARTGRSAATPLVAPRSRRRLNTIRPCRNTARQPLSCSDVSLPHLQ
jgi:hypothetical protein